MKGLPTNVTKGLTTSSRLVCDDNSGAKLLMIIGAIGTKGKLARNPSVGVGDIVIVSVKKGDPKIRKKVERAVITRQRKEFRRANGVRIMFEDNAGVLVDDQNLPKGTEIKGAIAREVAERYPKVAAIAAAVI
ncbi:50S ribosomal protein L14 [Candidatus Gugararchaeum adminiculabundum]|nr:50S ribosomal protein L14 [Candidatus Gugararchaeum adminiculabundum]